jgi:hypothetical protein
MNAFPKKTGAYEDDCFASDIVDSNSVKSLCAVAYKAAVNGSGVVRLTPLSTATIDLSRSPSATPLMPCKYLNASGLFNGGCPQP